MCYGMCIQIEWVVRSLTGQIYLNMHYKHPIRKIKYVNILMIKKNQRNI